MFGPLVTLFCFKLVRVYACVINDDGEKSVHANTQGYDGKQKIYWNFAASKESTPEKSKNGPLSSGHSLDVNVKKNCRIAVA